MQYSNHLAVAAFVAFVANLAAAHQDARKNNIKSAPETQPAAPRGFLDISAEAGVGTVGVCGPNAQIKKYILEVNGSGAALFDSDADGDLDLWLSNGSTLEALRDGKPGAGNSLYTNDGNAKFIDISARAGIGGSRWGNGVAAGDLDNDGDIDICVAEFGPECLYLNDGKSNFTEIGQKAGLTDPRWSSSITFFDYNRDGWLDIFVANYLKFNLKSPPPFGGDSQWRGHPVMRGPRGLEKDTSLLYKNDGAGDALHFTDVSVASGIALAAPTYTLGSLALDYDFDGDDDLYIANDSEPNEMFKNLGNGKFEPVGEMLGVAVDDHGKVGSGMGVCAGDFAGDGRFGIVVTNFSNQANNLYQYDGVMYTDESFPSGIGGPSVPKLGWGCQFFDADFDGLLDLFVTNGHVYPEADNRGTDTSYAQNNQLFKNIGGGKFKEFTTEANLLEKRVHRGAAFGDLDNDGDVDAVVTVLNGPPVILKNTMGDGRAWIAFALEGKKSNRSAYGAIVKVFAGNKTWTAACQPGSSFQCSNDSRVRFGLGGAASVDAVEIRWPSGAIETYKKLETRKMYHFVEGKNEKTNK
ncbi:MAG: CRTAC1 family protein [Planctomycetota bacterium]